MWWKREASITSRAKTLIRMRVPMPSLRRWNQTGRGQRFPSFTMRRKGKLFTPFFPSFLISLIADRSSSHPRDAITDLFCFTSSSGPSSTFSHYFDKSIYSGGSSFPLSPRRRNFLSLPGDLALLFTALLQFIHHSFMFFTVSKNVPLV